MQRHEAPHNAMLSELYKELDGVLDLYLKDIPRALRCALKLALKETIAGLDTNEIAPERILAAFIHEMAFELALHLDSVDTNGLTSELSALVMARMNPPAAAA